MILTLSLIFLMGATLALLGLALWMWDRATKRWMMMFCEKLSITPVNMEGDVKRVAEALVPLIPPQQPKQKRFSVPIPGAEMFRKEKTQ